MILNDITYKLDKMYTSFTYIFRKPYYRLRLFKRFMKHSYFGAWDMREYIMETTFECFCEFYENGGIDYIKWDSDKCHKKAKKEMDYLYQWWTKDRLDRQEELDTLLDEWVSHHISYFEKDDSFGGKVMLWKSKSTKYGQYLFDLHTKTEIFFIKEKENNFIRLVKIKDFLWT